MATNKHLRDSWQSTQSKELFKQRMIAWRTELATVRVERPMRLDRARAVGYKAQQGFVIVRQRVKRGGHRRPDIKMGRRSAHAHQRKNLSLNYRVIAERRANEKYQNLTVLNSYFLCKDAIHAWYEVILVDPQHPNIKRHTNLANMAAKRGRVKRGLTNAGRRGRGMKKKGKGREKNFPSLSNKHNKGRGN